MSITILYFGQISGLTSRSKEDVETVRDLQELKKMLFIKYPKLEDSNFVLSVNKVILEQADLKPGDEVAILPPFSGG